MQRVLAGEISPETPICKAGTNKWAPAPAPALKGLFPTTAVAGTAAKSRFAVKPPLTPATPPLALAVIIARIASSSDVSITLKVK